jgi:DNA-directed RNA polymerase specialized sigma24 family protein
MKTFEDFHPYLASTINGISHEYGRRGGWYGASHEDFSQEMIAWLLDHEQKIAARFSESVEDATAYVAKCLRNECKDHLVYLKGQASGDSGETQYDYGRDELKLVLQLMFNPADAEQCSVVVLESVADVQRTFARLGNEDQAILTAMHRDDYSNKMLAELYDISEANMSYRHNRAVLRLQKLLGGAQQAARTGFTGRRAISNSAARAALSHTYEDGESA